MGMMVLGVLERELETSMTKRSGKGWVVGVGSRDWGSQGAYLLKVPPRAVVAFRKRFFQKRYLSLACCSTASECVLSSVPSHSLLSIAR